MWHVEGRELHTGFIVGKPPSRDHLEYLGVDGRIIFK
jgi:hypothetical protein